MATVLKNKDREFKEDANKIEHFRLFSDVSRIQKGINPQQLNFDLRQLNPGQYSSLYHFHRHAEELFMVVSGTMTLRTPRGLEIVSGGDIVFFEMGESGAHQFFNHSSEPCIYLDVRTFMGYDVCEYPDSGKILLAPTYEIFDKKSQKRLYEGEENIKNIWEQLKNKE
jgi:uncharacterized cupin superfamily protein